MMHGQKNIKLKREVTSSIISSATHFLFKFIHAVPSPSNFIRWNVEFSYSFNLQTKGTISKIDLPRL